MHSGFARGNHGFGADERFGLVDALVDVNRVGITSVVGSIFVDGNLCEVLVAFKHGSRIHHAPSANTRSGATNTRSKGAIVVLQPEATILCGGNFSPFDVVAFLEYSPVHIGSDRIRSNIQCQRSAAAYEGGETNTRAGPSALASGRDRTHFDDVGRFSLQASQHERIAVGINGIDEGGFIFVIDANLPSGGSAILSPAQLGAVSTDGILVNDKVGRTLHRFMVIDIEYIVVLHACSTGTREEHSAFSIVERPRGFVGIIAVIPHEANILAANFECARG